LQATREIHTSEEMHNIQYYIIYTRVVAKYINERVCEDRGQGFKELSDTHVLMQYTALNFVDPQIAPL